MQVVTKAMELKSSRWCAIARFLLFVLVGDAILIQPSWTMKIRPVKPTYDQLDTLYQSTVRADQVREYRFQVSGSVNKMVAVRVNVSSSNAQETYPVMFVVIQQKGVISWELPLEVASSFYNQRYDTIARTLCPMDFGDKEVSNLVIRVTCISPSDTAYRLIVSTINDFEIKLSANHTVIATPSQPQYYYFKFPEAVDAVQVRGHSNDTICATISVQNATCPVFDLLRNVEFIGKHQTLTKQSSINIQKRYFSEFFIVLVVHLTDKECSKLNQGVSLGEEEFPAVGYKVDRTKSVTISIIHTASGSTYWESIVIAVSFYMGFYVLYGLIALLTNRCNRCKASERQRRPQDTEPLYISTPVGNPTTIALSSPVQPVRQPNNNEEADVVDCVCDNEASSRPQEGRADSRDGRAENNADRAKPPVSVADLSTHSHKHLTEKYKLYWCNLIPIAIFYALPVIQLVLAFQNIFHDNGDEDVCYYNFLCANRFGVLSSFNNVFSNVGYILLGILFLIITRREERKHIDRYKTRQKLGLPRYFGIFYAMGIALIMEGIHSACYHVCPTHDNFQFDTSYMYIMVGLSMLNLYQARHPDVTSTAHLTYICLAFVIILTVIGLVAQPVWFWAIFTTFYIVLTPVLYAEIYYVKGCSRDALKKSWKGVRECSGPKYPARILLLALGMLINFGLALFGAFKQSHDQVATYVLSILLVNCVLYTLYYIIMKYRSGELSLKKSKRPIVFLVLAIIFWVLALDYFFKGLAKWEKTPAESREGNRECILLDFYDHHDVWHFLSACGLFFTFMTLLTLDDDVDYNKPRDEIPAF